jgi:hypothetical protein
VLSKSTLLANVTGRWQVAQNAIVREDRAEKGEDRLTVLCCESQHTKAQIEAE